MEALKSSLLLIARYTIIRNMYLKEIRINHYKSIKDPVHLREFSNFQVLVGPNNAGKTNILDAIDLFFEEKFENERFSDKDADIEITLEHKGERHEMSLKEGKFNFPEEIDPGKHFIRINEELDYKVVAKKLESFQEEHPKEYEEFSSTLEKYFKEVEINKDLFLLNVFSDQRTRSVKRMGEGFKRLFVMLFYIFNPQYKIILIDEPEIHLHPSIIRKFLHILERENMGNQVLFTTHHPSFVQAKYLPKTWRAGRNENGNTAVYGFSEKNIDIDRFIQEINDDNSAMLFSDKVLLVEGVSDRIFMREMINKFYKKNKDIKVVYTSGKGSVDLYADLCEAYHIPYAIMLDKDALHTSSLQRVKKYPRLSKRSSLKEKLEKLKEEEIFILEKDLERAYPRKYRKHEKQESKPLAALLISQKMEKEDLEEKSMRVIKEILETI